MAAPDAASLAVIWIAREAVGALIWVLKRRKEKPGDSVDPDRATWGTLKTDVDRLLKWKHQISGDHERMLIMWKEFAKRHSLE